ncbi:alpha/beta fold hydrolase [Streptomyces sp. M19]
MPAGPPGRSHLRTLPLVDDCADLVGYFHERLAGWWDRPFVLFGHSMGGLLAYELTRALLADGGPLPRALHLSAVDPPTSRTRYDPPRHLLGDDELRSWLRASGASPPRFLDDERAWQRFSPALRADFAVVDSWRPALGAARCRCRCRSPAGWTTSWWTPRSSPSGRGARRTSTDRTSTPATTST